MPTETKPPYSPGLEGVLAGETSICWVDPNAGLLYRGFDVHELASHASFEEIVWLLLHGELPSMSEFAAIIRHLAAERSLPPKVIDMLHLMPHGAHPMDVLRTGVSMLSSFDPDLNDHSHDANLRKAIRVIPKISTLVTDSWRIRQGLELLPPKPDLPTASSFLYQLKSRTPEVWEAKMFDAILVLYAEHEFNASTFSARVTASTMADMYAAITTALGTLKGPLHGGANEETMKMLQEIGTPDRAESWLKERLSRKEKVMGFGHRVYKSGDSRVPMMREFARDLGRRFGKEHWVAICEKLEAVMDREKHLCANLDLYAAPVFLLLGIPPELNTPIFAVSRISGWCAHVIEQHDHNRLIRPRSIYIGKAKRPYQPESGA